MKMNISSASSLQLQVVAGQVLTLPQVDALTLEALAGSFWVTCGGRGRDHVLQPGERIRLDHTRQVVLEALQAGVLRLDTPDGGAAEVRPSGAASRGREPACMRNHVASERLAYRSLEFA